MDAWTCRRRPKRSQLLPLTLAAALAASLFGGTAGCGLTDDAFAGGSHDPPTAWKGSALEFCREDDEGYHCFYSDAQCFHWASWNGEDWEDDDWACSF